MRYILVFTLLLSSISLHFLLLNVFCPCLKDGIQYSRCVSRFCCRSFTLQSLYQWQFYNLSAIILIYADDILVAVKFSGFWSKEFHHQHVIDIESKEERSKHITLKDTLALHKIHVESFLMIFKQGNTLGILYS